MNNCSIFFRVLKNPRMAIRSSLLRNLQKRPYFASKVFAKSSVKKTIRSLKKTLYICIMENIEKKTARLLLEVRAVQLRPDKPFQWASGWKSPIYCDNRKTLSYPEIRNFIKNSFVTLINEKYLSTQAIAGVATGAIAQGALVADALGLPFCYVRPEPKGHGLENLIEGDPQPGQRVVVIEDLISTGNSSLKAVDG